MIANTMKGGQPQLSTPIVEHFIYYEMIYKRADALRAERGLATSRVDF
jgi:hypothetical protein